MTSNTNYDTYLGTATQLQRWRDFSAHLTAYLVVNALLIVLWAARGRGPFWPAWSLVGWGIGLSSQHFNMAIRGQISETQVLNAMQRRAPSTTPAAQQP